MPGLELDLYLPAETSAPAELELVPGATHMWKGAGDVDGIVRRSVEFLRSLG